MCEVVISCVTTFINDEGIVISELKSIWHNYWSSGWLFVDLIAAIPWELLFLLFGIDDVSTSYNHLHYKSSQLFEKMVKLFISNLTIYRTPGR